MNSCHVQSLAALVWLAHSPGSLSSNLADGKPRPTSAAGGFQASEFPSQTGHGGQDLLGAPPPLLSLWRTALIVVSPDTVVRWHRAGFHLYWRFLSRVRTPVARRPVTKEIRELIFQMVAENPTWRAPRIHGELAMLGFDVSEHSVPR